MTKSLEKFRRTLYKNRYKNISDKSLSILLKDEKITYDEAMILINENIVTKRKFISVCISCKNEFTYSTAQLKVRSYTHDSLCSKCYIPKYVCKTKKWKKKNSDAQFIAQNKPGAKEKMSKILKNTMNTTNMRENIRKGVLLAFKNDPTISKRISELSKMNHTKQEYREKVHGTINKGSIKTIKFGIVHFDSLLELSFIINCDNDKTIKSLSRWDKEAVNYEVDNIVCNYYPDFIVNNNTAIEIKSRYYLDINKVHVLAKQKYFKKLYKQYKYFIYFDDKIDKKYIINSIKKVAINFNYEITFYNRNKHNEFENWRAHSENKIKKVL